MSDRKTKIALVLLALFFLLALHVGYRWVGYRASPRREERPAGKLLAPTPPKQRPAFEEAPQPPAER